MKTKQILKNIKILLSRRPVSEAKIDGCQWKLTVKLDRKNKLHVLSATWDESPHNGIISDYKEIELSHGAIEEDDNSQLWHLYCNLREEYLYEKKDEIEKNMLKKIGIVEK